MHDPFQLHGSRWFIIRVPAMVQPEVPVKFGFKNVRNDVEHNMALARAHLEQLKASGEYATFLAELAQTSSRPSRSGSR